MFNLLPKDEEFFDELDKLSVCVVSVARQFQKMVRNFPNFSDQLRTIEDERLTARRIFKESLLRLDRAFITPIDREDILNLITEMYGVVDRVSELSQRFRLYQLQDLHPTLTGQASNLFTLSNQLSDLISGLSMKKTMNDLAPSLDAISAAMELVKQDREVFLGGLFTGNPDPLDVLKKKELHDLLEGAIERCEEASETLARVLLKNG